MMESILLNIRRGDTPFYRRIRGVAKRVRGGVLPVPGVLNPVLRLGYHAHHSAEVFLRWVISYFYAEPLFRGRCERTGRRLRIHRVPWVVGHAKISIGDDVNFFGKVDIVSGGILAEPKLVLGNRVDIGHNVVFLVNREIVIEDDVNVASGVRFMDSDAHPRDVAERIADLPPRPEEIKPIRIGRYAWIGQNAFILKGVTVGEGAVVGVNSVVVTDVPAYCVAMGNPARVVMKNVSSPPEHQQVAVATN